MVYRLTFIVLFIFLWSCVGTKTMHWSLQSSAKGSQYYQSAAGFNWRQRDSLTRKLILKGSIPSFLRRFVPIQSFWEDAISGAKIKLTYYVAPDYLAVGDEDDWARVHITPFLAQELADSLHCFLPTRKMVDQIYQAAKVKLSPVPLYAFRDSTPTFYHHHLIVEGQRKGRGGLIAGIQKDLVTTGKLDTYPRHDRVAIYGWHQLDGKPIQPLYTGHVYWYVDYSQGVRLVYEYLKVNGKWMHYTSIFKDEMLRKLICDEADCGNGRYPEFKPIDKQ